MWIVRLALRRPYTFVVMAVLIAILGGVAIVTMPVDIFPYIDIPVVSVVWNYSGLSPEEMEKRIVTIFERALTTTVNDIEHIESQSYNGVSVDPRLLSSPNVKVELALAQITAIAQTLLRAIAARHVPAEHPQVRRVQRADPAARPEQQDAERAGNLRHRPELHPHPAGDRAGRRRCRCRSAASSARSWWTSTPTQLYAKRLSPTDVSNALNLQNLILPAGTAKIGDTRISGQAEQQPARARRVEQPADQDGQRRDRLHAGRGAGARRLFGADQHRPHQRHARRAADRTAQRQGLHARRSSTT